MELNRHISFVDCPGHENLLSTMLGGTTTAHTALILIAGNIPCP